MNDKQKRKTTLVFFLIILVVLFNNFSGKSDYENLDKNISSIYKDRLMPANYLFQISDHLYQKKLLVQQTTPKQPVVANQLALHNKAIESLIKDYEATYLTNAEQKEWESFKQNLFAYNKVESSNSVALSASSQHPNFTLALHALNNLNKIQATEGNLLQRSSKAIIGGSIVSSYLEISMLVLLAIIAFAIIGSANKNDSGYYSISKEHLYN